MSHKRKTQGENCHCIPKGKQACPPRPSPTGNYDPSLLEELAAKKATTAYLLQCDPFEDANVKRYLHKTWQTVEMQQCSKVQDMCSDTYSLKSYQNENKATHDGATVTHIGACSVCSTTKDLAALLRNPNHEIEIIKCILKNTVIGMLPTDGQISDTVDCLVDQIGFTTECAKIWVYNGLQNAAQCFTECIARSCSCSTQHERL